MTPTYDIAEKFMSISLLAEIIHVNVLLEEIRHSKTDQHVNQRSSMLANSNSNIFTPLEPRFTPNFDDQENSQQESSDQKNLGCIQINTSLLTDSITQCFIDC